MPKTTKKIKEKEKEQKSKNPKAKKTSKNEKIEQVEKVKTETKKETMSTTITEEAAENTVNKKPTYYYAVGRRKKAIATVRLYKKGSGEIKINEKEIRKYFPREEWQMLVYAPLRAMGQINKLDVQIKVLGGGVKSQAEAIQLGIARALLKLNPIFKRGLKKYGYLTRDPRVKERKKYGLRGARRAPQWSKR